MGKRSGSKQAPARPAGSSGGSGTTAIIGAVVVVAAIGTFLAWPSGTDSASGTTPATGQSTTAAAPEATPQQVNNAAAKAALGPHAQASYPPIPFQAYQPPRPPDVVEAAYRWAAEHPEIASYVPCYCGCETAGHEGNTDCFVKSRAANGDVTEWDPHGVDCAVCIDVAIRSRQMHAAGASVRDIRAAIEKEFAPLYPGKMPTPHPPGAHGAHGTH